MSHGCFDQLIQHRFANSPVCIMCIKTWRSFRNGNFEEKLYSPPVANELAFTFCRLSSKEAWINSEWWFFFISFSLDSRIFRSKLVIKNRIIFRCDLQRQTIVLNQYFAALVLVWCILKIDRFHTEIFLRYCYDGMNVACCRVNIPIKLDLHFKWRNFEATLFSFCDDNGFNWRLFRSLVQVNASRIVGKWCTAITV